MAEKLIWVQAAKDDNRVALFEKDPRHPGGEAFVAQFPVQVALTAVVGRKLANGELKEVDAPKVSVSGPAHKTKEEIEAEISAIRQDEPVRRMGRPPKEKE